MKLSSISARALSFIVAIPVLVYADSASGIPLADAVRERSITIALWASAISVGLILIAIFAKNASNEFKKLLFALLVTAIVGPTIYFIGSTINLNLSSIANGPVHWHADFEIIACGEELPPPNAPHKLSNKTGTPVLHQHVDKRYHVEGVVLDLEEVALDRFFEVQGGTLTENTFRVPTGDTVKTYINGDACPNGEQGSWNVFLFKVDETTHTATQTKLVDYARYTPSAHELVPPGDCIIFEFGPERAYTDRLCNFHQIAVNKGELKIEVPAKTQGVGNSDHGVIDTSDWQTYRNEEYGYGFKYPAKFTISNVAAQIVVEHKYPYKNDGSCDMAESRPSDFAQDFHLAIAIESNPSPQVLRSYGVVLSENESAETLKEQVFIDEEIQFGSLQGFRQYTGSEGCGADIYLFPLSDGRVIIAVRRISQALTSYANGSWRNLPGIILDENAGKIAEQIIASMTF